MSHKTIFLDRDGVINKIVFREGRRTSPRHIDEFEIEADVEDSLKRLHAAGFIVDDIRVCPHDDHNGCTCRKPQPGMLVQLARDYDLALEESYIVGDTWKDTWAGRSVGCGSIILDRPYNRDDPADARVPNLTSAVDLITGEVRD